MIPSSDLLLRIAKRAVEKQIAVVEALVKAEAEATRPAHDIARRDFEAVIAIMDPDAYGQAMLAYLQQYGEDMWAKQSGLKFRRQERQGE